MGLFGKKKTSTGVPFEEIDSIEKARIEVERGGLERMYIVSPSLFGGSDGDDNVLYVPVGTTARKERIIDMRIADLMREGHKCSFNCHPEYKGRSVVPSKIIFVYTSDEPMTTKLTMDLW